MGEWESTEVAVNDEKSSHLYTKKLGYRLVETMVTTKADVKEKLIKQV